MSARLVEAIVGVAVFASAGILVAMFAVPFVGVAPVSAPGTTASPGPTVVVEPSADPRIPPLGSFQLGNPLDFGRICLGIELEARAYPVAAGARGEATVYWWESSIIDSGHPAACQSRSGDLNVEEAVVERVRDEDDPDGPPIGYSLLFHLPGPTGAERDMEIALLTAQSSPDRLQALDMTTSGSGLVFERVASIDPPFVPAPSASPPTTGQIGLFLLRGPLGADGPCLVLELDMAAYPTDPAATGTAGVRWWERAIADPTDPVACLGRIGDVAATAASVVAVRDEAAPGGAPVGYVVRFSLVMPGTGATQEVVLSIPFDQATPDGLAATAVAPEGVPPLVFDRVDSIDPPLVPSPSASPAP